MYEVSPADPGFIPTRDALVAVLHVSPAGAAQFLLRLRATEFEQLRQAAEGDSDASSQAIAVRICLAEVMATNALAKANEAGSQAGRVPTPPLALDLVDQAVALSLAAMWHARSARELVAAALAAEAAAIAAAAEEEGPAEAPAEAAPEPAGDVAGEAAEDPPSKS